MYDWQEIQVVHLSSVFGCFLNAWCTPRRFGEAGGICPFCVLELPEDIEHMLTCPSLQNLVLPGLRWSTHLNARTVFGFEHDTCICSDDEICAIAIYIYISTKLYNDSRHDGRPTPRRTSHHFDILKAHCPTSRKLIKKWNIAGGPVNV